MVRTILIILTCFTSLQLAAQKPQKIAYIDMEYILENVPEYVEAQSRLDERVKHWQKKLDDINRDIEVLKTDLANEKALLTRELIQEREEDIEIRELDLKNLQATYFGPNGDIFLLRRQLVKPIQDQVYNAVQEIAKGKKYDMVFDKSSDLIMLYTNKKYDISEQVLNRIVKARKAKAVQEKREARANKSNPELEKRLAAKEEAKKSRNDQLKARIEAQKKEKAEKQEALKKQREEKRRKRKEEQEKRAQEKLKKTNNN